MFSFRAAALEFRTGVALLLILGRHNDGYLDFAKYVNYFDF